MQSSRYDASKSSGNIACLVTEPPLTLTYEPRATFADAISRVLFYRNAHFRDVLGPAPCMSTAAEAAVECVILPWTRNAFAVGAW